MMEEKHTEISWAQLLDEAKKTLGKSGRLVVRPSGTEPLIRVMTEGDDRECIEKVARNVASVIRERLSDK